jgi:hypothetical protein
MIYLGHDAQRGSKIFLGALYALAAKRIEANDNDKKGAAQ